MKRLVALGIAMVFVLSACASEGGGNQDPKLGKVQLNPAGEEWCDGTTLVHHGLRYDKYVIPNSTRCQ